MQSPCRDQPDRTWPHLHARAAFQRHGPGLGRQHRGQLGDGTTQHRTPMPLPGLNGIVQVSANDPSFAVRFTGTSRLGQQRQQHRCPRPRGLCDVAIPSQIPGLAGISHLAATGDHVLALANSGTVYAWVHAPASSATAPPPTGRSRSRCRSAGYQDHQAWLQRAIPDGTLLTWSTTATRACVGTCCRVSNPVSSPSPASRPSARCRRDEWMLAVGTQAPPPSLAVVPNSAATAGPSRQSLQGRRPGARHRRSVVDNSCNNLAPSYPRPPAGSHVSLFRGLDHDRCASPSTRARSGPTRARG